MRPAKKLRPDSLAVHAGRFDFAELGVHAPPIDLSSTYPLGDLGAAGEELEALAHGGKPTGNGVYARLHNPTVARFEEALADLEGASDAIAFSSGMAAVTATLLGVVGAGGHVVAIRPLYGGTDHLLASRMLGIETTFVDPAGVAAAIRPDTRLVLVETPANPTLQLVDLEQVVAAAGTVPVCVDSTFMTPVLQQPLRHGVRLVLHSATKALGGHGDVLAGVVATNDVGLAAAIRSVRVVTGAVLHPLAAFLLLRALPTLPLRVRAAQANAAILAPRLAEHPAVRRVFWPGMPGADVDALIGRQMAGPGSVLALELEGGQAAVETFVRSLELATHAVSLGATDTLVQQPASLTHRVVDPEARRATGISEGLVRISVGIEDAEDLWEDFSRALDRAMVAQEVAVGR